MPVAKRQSPTPKIASSPAPSEGADVWGATDSLRMLIYGKSGTGKTTLAGTFPGPILWLICSGGSRPGELKSINTPEHRKKITPRIITSTDQVVEEVARAGNYATVVLDHASGFADLIIKELLGLEEIPLTKARQAGKGESWSLVSQQQYGQLAIQCKETFRSMLNLPGNILILAQERTFGEESVSELIAPTVGAAMTPSVAGWLNPACDYVVQTFIRPKMRVERTIMNGKPVLDPITKEPIETRVRTRGVEYCLRTGPHDVFMTKFRRPRTDKELPEVIVDPDYSKIMAVIGGEG